jgi:pimeloyl-ACP methyl ester carboxylesterase
MTTNEALTDLYVHESGTPGSPAIVFLHADGASGGMWDRHMRRLAGYHCLAPDLPGHGRSNQLPWTSLDDATQQVVGLIEDRIPTRRAHVVGLSLGGVVAHTLLAQRPELLDRVVIDGAGVLPSREAGIWRLGIALGIALVAPFLHRRLVIGLLYRALGGDPGDPVGRGRFRRRPAGGLAFGLPARLRRRQRQPPVLQGRAQRPVPDPASGGGTRARSRPRLEHRAGRPDAQGGG